MNRIATISQYFDNLANPILVKEIRQAVKGKFLIIVMGLILIAQLIIWWIITLPDTSSNVSGRSAYILMLSLFGIALGITMPIYTGFRILAERARQDLLYVSALSPFQIIWGKFLSCSSIILIVFTTFLPFFYLTLLIGGIDTWTITYSLIVTVMALLGSVMFTILALCPVVPILLKVFLVLLTLFGLYMIGFLAVVSLVGVFALDLYAGSESERFFIALSWLIGGPIVIGFLIVLAASAISPASSNRAVLPRIYATIAVLISVPLIVLCIKLSVPVGLPPDFMEFVIFLESSVLYWAGILFLLVSASGRFHYGIRLRRQIPTSRTKRFMWFPFYSGAANGISWSFLFLAAAFAMLTYLHIFQTNDYLLNIDFGTSLFHFIAYFNYLAIYAWLGMIFASLFGLFRPGLWSILICGFTAMLTSIIYFSFLDSSDESLLILLPNAPVFFSDGIYALCLATSVINVLTFVFVLSQIVGPQTARFFTSSNMAEEIEQKPKDPKQELPVAPTGSG